MIIYTPTNKRPILIQFRAINAVYCKFETEFIEIINNTNTYGLKDQKEKLLLSRYIHQKEIFKKVLHVLKFCTSRNISLNKYFKDNSNSSPISKRHFFREKLKLCKLCDKRVINFEWYIPKSPIPKNIVFKYG